MSSSDRISLSSIDLVELARRAAAESDRHFLNVVRALGSGARRMSDSVRFVVGKATGLGAKLRRPAQVKTILDLLRMEAARRGLDISADELARLADIVERVLSGALSPENVRLEVGPLAATRELCGFAVRRVSSEATGPKRAALLRQIFQENQAIQSSKNEPDDRSS